MTVLITLTTAGADTGPFNLYSDVDGYTSPFESSVSKASLLAGYTSYLVPDGTNVIRVLSQGLCANYIDIVIGVAPTTTTTSTLCVRPDGLTDFVLNYAVVSPYLDFRGSLDDACASTNAEDYIGFAAQSASLLVGETVYYGLSTSCVTVPTGYYIVGDSVIVYIVDGIVVSYPTCTTTTTTTNGSTTTTTTSSSSTTTTTTTETPIPIQLCCANSNSVDAVCFTAYGSGALDSCAALGYFDCNNPLGCPE